MPENLTIEEENEIIIARLARYAGYDLERDKKKAEDEDKMAEMSPVDRLRMVNERVNREAIA